MIRPTHIQADTGLCQYEPPDSWFDPKRIQVSLAICTNCPVRQACGQSALDRGEAYGIWGGVKLPGISDLAELAVARQELQQVVARLAQAPLEERLRTLRLRAAIHYAAMVTDRRLQEARERRAVAIRAAVERRERVGA
jgi:WhiB family redox-sensing transcriptional regulator